MPRLDAFPQHLFLLALIGGTPAWAEQRLKVDLVQAGIVDSTGYQVTPDRHDFFMGVSKWSAPEPDDPASPFRGLEGRGFGTTDCEGDVIVAGGGYCTYLDAAGHALVTRWEPKEQPGGGRTRGVWTVHSGDGKWRGATGGGEFLTERSGGDGQRTRRLTGEIVLP